MTLPTDRLSIRKQCAHLEVSRLSYYYVPAAESEATIAQMHRIDEIFTANPDYGSRMIRKVLCREDNLVVNRKRIHRLMRNLTITAQNHVWCTDITYNRMKRRPDYLVAVMDWLPKNPVVGEIPVAGQRLLHLSAQMRPGPVGKARNLQLRSRLAVQQRRLPEGPQ